MARLSKRERARLETWLVNEWVRYLEMLDDRIRLMRGLKPRPIGDTTVLWRVACKCVKQIGLVHPSRVLAGFPEHRPDIPPIL